jgi:hypothetical protein
VIGRLLAATWLDTLEGSNPFAVALFSQTMIMVFYFPANNQIFQVGESFAAFVGTLMLWLVTRQRRPMSRASS